MIYWQYQGRMFQVGKARVEHVAEFRDYVIQIVLLLEYKSR